MGNNAAFSAFEEVVHACYAENALTLPLLKRITKDSFDVRVVAGVGVVILHIVTPQRIVRKGREVKHG